MQPHWWGILGLIGWAYLYGSVIYALCRARAVPILVAALLLVIFHLLPWRVLPTHAGNATHTSIVLLGIVLSRLVFGAERELTHRVRMGRALALAAALAALALLIHPLSPISKVLATPSWALLSCSGAILAYTALYYAMDVRGVRLRFLEPAATNALLIHGAGYPLSACSPAGWHAGACVCLDRLDGHPLTQRCTRWRSSGRRADSSGCICGCDSSGGASQSGTNDPLDLAL